MYTNRSEKDGPSEGSGHSCNTPELAEATDAFEKFVAASTFKSVLHHHRHMCDVLKIYPTNIRQFYPKLKSRLNTWRAQALWAKFDKRASHKCYNHGKACSNTKVLIIGCGPCGLRTAIEAQLLGAQVVVVEKRDRFTRHNVLHLWPFVIADLKALGAKKFYGKFCAGSIDHISIRQLQCILLKVALLLGVHIFEGVCFEELLPPPEDQTERIGWRARFNQPEHSLHQYEFDVLIGADGKRNTLPGFKRTEFRGKLAIAVTANFINRRTELESSIPEISGVAFIFNQKFFKEMKAATGIDLENIVYYKDETHYFVMTAKKQSLIDKSVIKEDLIDTQMLLHPNNVNREALQDYAREAADFATNYQMPQFDFAVNHYGHPDVAMFDFTSMFAAETACRAHQIHGHRLLMGLVGDSLLEPFWPTGSGCARGFLSSFDAAWMMRSWAVCGNSGNVLEVLAERESIYRLLAQTTPRNLSKDLSSYALDPSSRYPTINTRAVLPFQVRGLFSTDDQQGLAVMLATDNTTVTVDASSEQLNRKRKRQDSLVDPDALLNWCKRQVSHLPDVIIADFTTSFKSGLALCGILHRYRPEVVLLDELSAENGAINNQLAFDILESEFGIPPILTGVELACDADRLMMISYLSKVYHVLKGEVPHVPYDQHDLTDELQEDVQFAADSRGLPYSYRELSGSSASVKRNRGDLTSAQAEIRRRRLEEIENNRAYRLSRQNKQRELDTVRFVRSMRLLHDSGLARQYDTSHDNGDLGSVSDLSTKTNDDAKHTSSSRGVISRALAASAAAAHASLIGPPVQSCYNPEEDEGLKQYRKEAVLSMRQKAKDLERKIYFSGLSVNGSSTSRRPLTSDREDFDDRVKYLEAKFKGEPHQDYFLRTNKKPKELNRAIGRLEKTDWNLAAIERKIDENWRPVVSGEAERVPKWDRHCYDEKMNTIERRMRANGEDEETIAKYKDVDAHLKRLETKLREGSTLEVGLKGHNKVSNLASQLSSKLKPSYDRTRTEVKAPVLVQLPTTSSDLCYFCGTRVYLVEKLSAEGKFFHRQCFKCHYCNVLLRLGNYIYDREGRYGGKFFCIPHFGLTVPACQRRVGSGSPGLTTNVQTDRGKFTSPVPAQRTASAPALATNALGKHGGVAAVVRADMEDRGTTPERVEFENSLVAQGSDEEDYLSEEEWTDRNFGASANELDGNSSNDSDDYTDSEEGVAVCEDAENDQVAAAAAGEDAARSGSSLGKKKHARVKQPRGYQPHDSESELDSDDYSEDCAADGDESHTATEGEGGGDDDDECEEDRRQRERRRLEIKHTTPLKRHDDTTDSESDTEIEGASEESDTQIDTDSEFDEMEERKNKLHEIPKIVIYEDDSHARVRESSKPPETSVQPSNVSPPREGAEKSASMTSLSDLSRPVLSKDASVSPAEQLRQRLLMRTESNEALTSRRNLALRRQYLLGQGSSLPKKSVSTADLGNRFKSFMEKISETQRMLQPAPEPSPAMQAYVSSAFPKTSPLILSPLSPVMTNKFAQDSSSNTQVAQALNTPVINTIQLDNSFFESPIEAVSPEVRAENFRNETLTKSGTLSNDEFSSDLTTDGVPSIIVATKPNNTNENDNLSDKNENLLHSEPEEGPIEGLPNGLDDAVIEAHPNSQKEPVTLELPHIIQLSESVDEALGANFSLHSVRSVPSDVDDLFEVLASEAQQDVSEFPSLSAVIPELADVSQEVVNQYERPALQATSHYSEQKVQALDVATENNNLSFAEFKSKTGSLKVENEDLEQIPIAEISPEDSSTTRSFEKASKSAPFEENCLLPLRGVARVASIESLGDTDASGSGPRLSSDSSKCPRPVPTVEDDKLPPSIPSHPPPLDDEIEDKSRVLEAELEALEFVDSDDKNNELIENVEAQDKLKQPEGPNLEPLSSSSESRDLTVSDISYEKIVNYTFDSVPSLSPSNNAKHFTESPQVERMISPENSSISKKEKSSSTNNSDLHSEVNGNIESCQSKNLHEDKYSGFTRRHSVSRLDTSKDRNTDDNSETKIAFEGLDTKHSPGQEKQCAPETVIQSGLPGSQLSQIEKESGVDNRTNNFAGSPSRSTMPPSSELVRNVLLNTKISVVKLDDSKNSNGVENKTDTSNESKFGSVLDKSNSTSTSPRRYEGYVQRFRDHVSPGSRCRNFFDAKKEYSSAFSSPSNADSSLAKDATSDSTSVGNSTGFSNKSANTVYTTSETAAALRKIEKNALNTKMKDGDVVQQLVLSRIARKNIERSNKRGSRSTLSPLNSKDNLLDEACPTDSRDDTCLVDIQNRSTSHHIAPSFNSLMECLPTECNQQYVPKYSHYSPIETRLGRQRSNTVCVISRNDKAVSLTNLPATPLTHPHQFENISSLSQSVYSSAAASTDRTSIVDSPLSRSYLEHGRLTSTPDFASSSQISSRKQVKLNMNDSVSTKLDTGCSPMHLSTTPSLRCPDYTGYTLPPEEKHTRSPTTPRRSKEIVNDDTRELAVLSDHNREKRVRQLLAEQRARDLDPKTYNARQNREEIVAEKLLQFRAKKFTLPLVDSSSAGVSFIAEDLDGYQESNRKKPSRPSLLELESMQVFSKIPPSSRPVTDYGQETIQHEQFRLSGNFGLPAPPSRLTPAAPAVAPPPVKPPESDPYSTSSTAPVLTPPLSTSTPLSATAPPLTPSQIYGDSAPLSPEKPPSRKKSKDRERRRSLIQVFTGIFKSATSEERKDSDSVPSSGASSPPSSLVAPKSPVLAVRDKLSRLRLSKKESRGSKKRSSSSEVLTERSLKEQRLLPLSLPSSPGHEGSGSLHTSSSMHVSVSTSRLPTRASESSAAYIGSSSSFGSPAIAEESLTDCDEMRLLVEPDATQHAFAANISRDSELKRLRQAQEIQRQLEECEAKTRQLEERGITVEKSLRGEPGGELREETDLMSEWFRLVHEKNSLARWEQELTIRARDLELENKDARLQQDMARRGGGSEADKLELLMIREEREHLQAILEQDRLKYIEEDRTLEGVMLSKGLPLTSLRRETGV